MANTKSAAKRARTSERRRSRNQATRSMVKNTARRIRKLVAEGKKDEAAKLLPGFQSEATKASKDGSIHKRTVSRYTSRLANLVK